MCYPFPVYPILVYNAPFPQRIHPYPLFEGGAPQVGQSGQPAGFSNGRQQYPEVDPSIFHQSDESLSSLMDDGKTLLAKLNESESFATEVMDAAQKGDKEKVKQLIESTGIQGAVKTSFNPDSITITLHSNDNEA